MKTNDLLEKSKEMRTNVSAFAGYLKENYGEEIMCKSSLISQMFHAVEDFYWEITGIVADMRNKDGDVRYFVDGIQVSKSEADRIKADNDLFLEKAKATGNVEHLAKCKFVVEL
jgi:hypothetical protein